MMAVVAGMQAHERDAGVIQIGCRALLVLTRTPTCAYMYPPPHMTHMCLPSTPYRLCFVWEHHKLCMEASQFTFVMFL
jgi:hypothetical protein